MKRYLILFLLISGIQQTAKLHPVNMTVTDITIKDNKLNMKIKLFTDDFQSSISHIFKTQIDFINQPLSKGETHIKNYISTRLEVSVDGKPLKWNFKQTWLSNEVIYVEYESDFKNPEKIKNLKIKDVLLFDDFPEQKNIVNVTLNEDLQVLIFDNGSDDRIKKINF